MKIIEHCKFEIVIGYRRIFDRFDEPGCGYSFPCTQDGTVDEDKLEPLACENYRKCIDGTYDFLVDCGVQEYSWNYKTPSVGLCCCGEEIFLDHFTNTCTCGIDYNSAGQQLAPREQWGEETDERWTDCY